MKTRSAVIAGLVLAAVLIWAVSGRGDDDGIIEGEVYALGYTYAATIEGSETPARVFDFADRNLPRTSILVPLQDARGIALVREDNSMDPSTVRKMRITVPAVEVEGVKYPAYTYIEWQYNLGTKEPQSVVPRVIPRAGK